MRKFISGVLSVLVLMSIFYITQVSAAIPTKDVIKQRLDSLKSQYPDGTLQTKFFNATYKGESCYKDLSGYCSWQCLAWGCKVYDTLWGQSISTGQTFTNVSDICIGDYVRYNSTNKYDHSIIITGISGNTLYYTDCNGGTFNNVSYSNKIKWDRTISKADLQTKVNKKLVDSAGYGYIRHQNGNDYKDLIPSSPPAKPSMTNVSVNGSNVTVSWNAVSGAAQYFVDFCAVNGSSFTHNYKETTNTSITQSLADGEYAIRVGAKNSAGESGYTGFYYIDVVANPIPISFDANGGELEKTKARIAYDSINGERGADKLVLYTNGSSRTGTNAYGTEVLVQGNKIINIENGIGNATVPISGFVVSAHGTKRQQLSDNVNDDDYINVHGNPNEIWIWTKNGWLTWTKKVKNGGNYGDLPIPLSRDGYEFVGWFTSAEGGTQITNETTVTTNSAQTLYAHWEEKQLLTEVQVVKNGNSYRISAKCFEIENAKIIVTGYKNNELLSIEILNSDNIKPISFTGNFDTFKVMTWKISALKPLCKTEIVPQNKWIIE